MIKSGAQIKAFAGNEAERTYQLLDVRGPPQDFANGHVEGSKHFPIPKVFDMNAKTLKPAEERKKMFQEAGVDLSKDISLSCMSGVAATVVFGALADISTGNNSVYDGSWSEYSKM